MIAEADSKDDARLNIASSRQPAVPGYDHDWFRFQPLVARSAHPWPDGRPVAVAMLLDVRAAEWEPTAPEVAVPGGRGAAPYPDYPRLSHREFGHRVGIWRLSSLFAELGLAWTAVLDVLTAERYNAVRALVVDQASDLVAGGLSASRPITSAMAPDEERAYVKATLDQIEQATGIRPAAWMGPGWSQSANTPRILSEAGIELMLDWGNDELPYPVEGARPLWAMPVSWELTDVAAMLDRDVEPSVYTESIELAIDALARDGQSTPRMLCLHLHPWLSGEAFRTRALRQMLARLARRTDVWFATPQQIADHVSGRDL